MFFIKDYFFPKLKKKYASPLILVLYRAFMRSSCVRELCLIAVNNGAQSDYYRPEAWPRRDPGNHSGPGQDAGSSFLGQAKIGPKVVPSGPFTDSGR